MNDQAAAVAWLRQVIEGDKALAEQARHGGDGRWWRNYGAADEACGHLVTGDEGEWMPDVVVYDEGRPDSIQFEHIGRHDPRDTIARCDAELAILAEHHILSSGDRTARYEDFSVLRSGGAPHDHGCVCCHYYAQGAVQGFGVCVTVRALASAYQHREGYAEHWDPVPV
jgi:Family of unknown function (DUF6221)